jgi:ribose/xylose/arabinose/galactoside ABC-type transport system permease subunit
MSGSRPEAEHSLSVPAAHARRSAITRLFRHKELTALVILLLLVLVVSVANENFLGLRSLTLALRSLSFVGIAALGAMVVLSTGQLDLSVGSCMGLGGILAAYAAVHLQVPDPLIVMMVLAIGALYGAVNGALIVGLKLNSLIVTLATALIGRGIVYAITNGNPIDGFSEGLRPLGAAYFGGLPVPVWILLGLMLFFIWLMSRTRFGWNVYAIGGNEEAARLSGVPVGFIKFAAFVVGGTTAALGGFLLTARLGSGEVGLGSGYELDVIAAAVIGGLRFGAGSSGVSPIGMILGVAVMSVLRTALSFLDVSTTYQPIVLGCAILLAMGLERMRTLRRG